jgi:DHA1 family tetracycline resistance protein-like MFS transporter
MKRSPLFIVFLTVFIDLLGFGIVIPVIPAFAQNSLHASSATIGLIIATFSLMQTIFTPILGKLSDKIGRKPLILLSLAGAAVSYLIFGLATSILMIFISRALAGICAGSVSAAQAYIADITTPEKRAKGMGLIGVAFSLGFVFGPALGGVLTNAYGPSMPGFVAAALSGFSFIFAIFALPESLTPEKRAELAQQPQGESRWKELIAVLKSPTIGVLIMLFFFATFSVANIYGTFTLLCLDDFHMTVAQNGYLFGYMGLIGAIVQGSIHLFTRRFRETRIMIAGCIIMAIGLSMFGVAHSVAMLIGALTLLAVGNGMTTPTLLALISKSARRHEQGSVLGINQSASSLARVFGPSWGDWAYQYFGHGSPFFTGGIVMAVVSAGGVIFASRSPISE